MPVRGTTRPSIRTRTGQRRSRRTSPPLSSSTRQNVRSPRASAGTC
jgi:hypothetical protein